MRTFSSVRVVGAATPLMNWVPRVGAGKIPAFNRVCAFGSSKLDGMVLFGNGCPGVRPSAVNFARIDGATWEAEGTVMVGPPTILPVYQLESGTVWLMTPPPCTYLRHSML